MVMSVAFFGRVLGRLVVLITSGVGLGIWDRLVLATDIAVRTRFPCLSLGILGGIFNGAVFHRLFVWYGPVSATL